MDTYTQGLWMMCARRAAPAIYACEELVDDHEEKFVQLCNEGVTPVDAVKEFGEKYGLTPRSEWKGKL